MKVVVDTNIVFSALLNASSTIGDLLFNSQEEFDFYSPELMKTEIIRYTPKLIKASKLTNSQFLEAAYQVSQAVKLISEALISESSWKAAFELTSDIDEDDTPFVALTLELKGMLWTGAKKLIKGLREKKFGSVLSTQDLLKERRQF
ncbi:hypothetical protein BH24BAC1_BH24BAC1_37100 [soil metagenome]